MKLFIEWLEEVEIKALADSETVFNEISEKKAALELYKTLSKDVNCHGEAEEKLTALAGEKSGTKIASEIHETLTRYDDVKTLIENTIQVR